MHYYIGKLHVGFKAFRSGWNETADLHHAVHSYIFQDRVHYLSDLLSVDRRWIVQELSSEIVICHQTLCHMMKKCLNMRKIAVGWVPHQLTEVQKCTSIYRLESTWRYRSERKRISEAYCRH
ncbi:hypothetical protein TNCV_4243141 [Trichonephila clavipes]|nr:hypothetical protein TNCV_4243141 [Trichonephila clavipes]